MRRTTPRMTSSASPARSERVEVPITSPEANSWVTSDELTL